MPDTMEAVASKAPRERNELFQKLKPCCVKISQLAIRESATPASSRELVELTNSLLEILHRQLQQSPIALDDKLAEYVFFPLYHIFRQVDQYPMILIENCVRILTVLIVHGWRSNISAKLVQQILSLLVFIIDGVPAAPVKRDVPEETVLEGFRALSALFTVAGSSATAASGLVDSDTIPALGHAITVILEGVVDGASEPIQQEALSAIQGVFMAVRDHAALASFLPGTVSHLAKVLSTPEHYKRAILSKSLETLSLVLTRVLADIRTRSILAKDNEKEEENSDKSAVLGPAWLKATTAQVKLGLSTIMKLRTYGALDVREALRRLCVTLLDECHTTLGNCAFFLVESAMVLDNGADRDSMLETSLEDLGNIYPELSEMAKTIVYNWMLSLPRILQASDEDAKERATHNLSKGIEMLRHLQIESSTLDEALANTLVDGVVYLAAGNKPQSNSHEHQMELLDQPTSLTGTEESRFQPVFITHESQRQLRREMMRLISVLGSGLQQTTFASRMVDYMRESTSTSRAAAFWLCFELVKASEESSADTDQFLDLQEFVSPPDVRVGVSDELYSFSLEVLNSHTELTADDWRLEAIALEVTTHAAQRAERKFRPELLDVLFPVATFLGSDIVELRRHAIATLNGLAAACEYGSVSELIIENVDYMVNTVSLDLNTLNISPVSTNVLRMMIHLAGPRLIPFLDDVVESIFAALENYHGYSAFVQSLFSVLKEFVDQAARSNLLLLEGQKSSAASHRKQRSPVDGLQRLLDDLDQRAAREKRDADESGMGESSESHPKTPWKVKPGEEKGEQDQGGSQEEVEKPPNSPTFQLLLRVTYLTQHYLTSPTPELRRSLLELLSIASPALAADEEAFLPLVNAVWPVVISRLQDAESYIVVEACNTLSELCAAAGDFMSSRFKTEWGNGLGSWCRKVKREAASRGTTVTNSQGRRGAFLGAEEKNILIPIRGPDGIGAKEASGSVQPYAGGLGKHASPARVWQATVKLLTSVVSYVRIDDQMFDEVLDLLSDSLEANEEVRDALETINADAVWLVRYEKGRVEMQATPQLDGVTFAKV